LDIRYGSKPRRLVARKPKTSFAEVTRPNDNY
jgi:hypothetical protein